MIRITEGALFFGAFSLSLFFLFLGNAAIFPLDMADFTFFVMIAFFFALYRPGWAFLVFLSLLPFEMINLSPEALAFSLRPYQLLGGVLLLSMLARFIVHRLPFPVMRFRWFDIVPIVFGLGGFLAIGFASDALSATKQAVIALSFVALYFLSRQFLGEARDVRRVMPFLVLSSVCTMLFALWQSVQFTAGRISFEVMSGRPNAFFAEPDWLGMFLVLSGSVALGLLFYYLDQHHAKESIENTPFAEPSFLNRSIYALSHYSRTLFLLFVFCFLTLSWLGILLTVARSAWVGFAFSTLLFLKLLLVGGHSWSFRNWRWKLFAQGCVVAAVSFVGALIMVWGFQLTTFDLTNRAGSTTSGQQEITVSCEAPATLPERIENVSELSSYGCRFIRLEEIDAEQSAGRFVSTVSRPDPSIEARRVIGQKTFETLKAHWVFGIGWGNIGSILGMDDRGATLNASNAFLESWLGGGILSAFAFLVLWMLVPIFALRTFFGSGSESNQGVSRAVAVFFLVSWIGFTVFNVFNSGILLGFVWIWLGSIGIIAGKGK
ncbi:MAG: hypothetical protein WAU31_02265 [Candidatus Moraniibacteriota bacterium]